jgi:hypothetical protein
MTGTVGENRDRLISFIEGQGIELAFTEKIAPALGTSYGGKIAILPGQSEAGEFSTRVHELAHEMLHKSERRTTTAKVVRECRLHQSLSWRRFALGRELGSHPADLRCHPCRLAATHRGAGSHARCRTGEGGLTQTILQILKRAWGWHLGLYLKIDNAP